MAEMKTAFPERYEYPGSAPTIADGKIAFSYIDSFGRAQTETRPLLKPEQIAAKVQARIERFHSASPAARESEKSRRERKYIGAHPEKILRAAFAAMDEMQRMELAMMLDKRSHGVNSSRQWAEHHQEPRTVVVGDDDKPLAGAGAPRAQPLGEGG